MPEARVPAVTIEPSESLITLTHIIYGLHAFSLITGIIGAATVVGAFSPAGPRSSLSS